MNGFGEPGGTDGRCMRNHLHSENAACLGHRDWRSPPEMTTAGAARATVRFQILGQEEAGRRESTLATVAVNEPPPS